MKVRDFTCNGNCKSCQFRNTHIVFSNSDKCLRPCKGNCSNCIDTECENHPEFKDWEDNFDKILLAGPNYYRD